jgi:hypothetical protein
MIAPDMAIAVASLIRHSAPMPKRRDAIDVMIDTHLWMRRQEARELAKQAAKSGRASSPRAKRSPGASSGCASRIARG